MAKSVYSNISFRKYVFTCTFPKDWEILTELLRVVIYLSFHSIAVG